MSERPAPKSVGDPRLVDEDEPQQLKDESTNNDKDAESQRPEWDGTLVCEFVPRRGLDSILPLAHLLCEQFVLLAHLEWGRHLELGVRVEMSSNE